MNFAAQAIQLMLDEIKKYGLELMTRYPNDLLVHDRKMLEMAAYPGAMVAWMVGHSHTHLVRLGIHAKENEMVSYLTNMSADDRFYLLTVNQEGCKLKERTRDEFIALGRTPIAYKRLGTSESFTLYRKDVKVGHVVVHTKGSLMDRHYEVEVVKHTRDKCDDAALHVWSEKAVVEIAHTLFARFETRWTEAEVVA